MTDNRTNEPTEAQLLAALNANLTVEREQAGARGAAHSRTLDDWSEQSKDRMRAALVAAAGVAPQAENDRALEIAHELAKVHTFTLADGEAIARAALSLAAPVQPSSTVDEGKIAEVVRGLRFNDAGCWTGGIDCTESVTDHAEHIARAVIEFLGERHEPEPDDCPNHKPVQHRDGKPPWCNTCGRASVPDASFELAKIKPLFENLSREYPVECNKRVKAEAERDAALAAIEHLKAELESRIEDRDYWYGIATAAKDQSDAALAALERIREAVSGHPECDRYEEGDVISCGWKSAYASVVAALDGEPEPEEKP